ncbi:MAG: histidine kinase [Melioribacteraceae bacterium]|nr:histidine kinase [Melioribacteraceae bacterium]
MPSNECNQNAIYNDSKGNIWVGTIKGAIKYSPINDKKSLNPPMLNISSVKLFNEKIDFFNKIKLNYNQNYLSFEFTGIDFSAPHKVKYAYKMQGVDDDWIVTKRNFVQYTNLNNGQYLLQVKAANEWGIWSEPKSLQFTILPAFWETWWFITLIILTVTGSIVWIVTNKVKHLIAIERLRSNISADLHDDIGSGLSEVSLLSEIINYKLSKNEVKKISSELNKIGNISREIIESMSDIVWFVNPKNDSLFDLISRLGDAYHVTLSSKNILLDLQNIDLLQKINLSMEYRQNLYLLIKEGINNSLKYSKCSKITLNTNVKGKTLTCNLTDNGIGFDSEKILKGNGLKNMKIRSKKLGGKIEIISKIGNGTQIIFSGKITN